MELNDTTNQVSNGEESVVNQTTVENGSNEDQGKGGTEEVSLFDALQAKAESVDVEEIELEDDSKEEEKPVEIEFEIEDEDEDTEDEETEDEGQPAKAASTDYIPDHKYKALGEEFEFDEELKSIIKDKDTEEKYRKIMSKAKGLDFYEEKHKKLEDSHADLTHTHEEYKKDAIELAGVVRNFNEYAQSENVEDNYQALAQTGFTDNKILNLARHVLNLQKMDPSQRKAYDQRFTQQTQLNEYQGELEASKKRVSNLEMEKEQAKFEGFLSGHTDLVSEFEAREGFGEGSFKVDFINFGATLEKRLGKELEYGHVLNEFKRIHHLGNKPAPKPAAKKKVPETIPNLKGSGQSPISKGFESMDDLRKFRDANNI